MHRFLFTIFCLLLIPASAYSQEVEDFEIASGTGFFINRQYVITNAHVVDGCSDVIINGAVPERKAPVRFVDKTRDLALIESDIPPQEFAPLRYNIDDLKPGDKVMVIGYPGEEGAKGRATVAEAQVVAIKPDDNSQNKWLYITDVVAHGNSGGPVFDTSGNVIGVVVAEAELPFSNPVTHEVIKTVKVGVVITLRTLQQFLFDHGVFSTLSGSGVAFTDSYIEARAKDYIVNVQCRLKVTHHAQDTAN